MTRESRQLFLTPWPLGTGPPVLRGFRGSQGWPVPSLRVQPALMGAAGHPESHAVAADRCLGLTAEQASSALCPGTLFP